MNTDWNDTILALRYVQKHQSGYQYKRRIPHSVKAEPFYEGKTWIVQNYPKSLGDKLIVSKIAAKTVLDTAKINELKGRELTEEEKKATFYDLMIHEGTTKTEALAMVEKFFTAKARPKGLDRRDNVFIEGMLNEGVMPSSSPLLSAVAKADQERRPERNEKTFMYPVNDFIGTMSDMSVDAITYQDVESYIAGCDRLAPMTISRNVGTLQGILTRYYRREGVDKTNPFAGHTIIKSADKRAAKMPFHRNHLAAIDNYLSRGRCRQETKNLMRLMRLTGAGAKELGGLTVADVDLTADIPYFHLRHTDCRILKNDMRDRMVPLIGDALVAMQEVMETATMTNLSKRAEDIQLFTGFKWGEPEGAANLSQNMNNAINVALGYKAVKDENGKTIKNRLTSYSFRHTFKDALRQAHVPMERQNDICGHTGAGAQSAYGGKYAPLDAMRSDMLAATEYLGNAPRTNYTSEEWID